MVDPVGMSGSQYGIDGRFGDGDVLLHRAGACADGTDHQAVADDRDATTKDDDVSAVRLLNAVKWT